MASIADGSVRGRDAESPHEIPPRGWKDVLIRTFKEVGNDRVTLISAGVTYFLLLSLFPSLSALVSIYGLVADPLTVRDHLATLSGVIPEGGFAIIDEQLTRITSQDAPSLGFALLLSLAIALWSSSAGVKTLIEAMNIAYGEREKRNFFVVNAMGLGFTLLGLIAALVMLGVVVALPALLGFVFLGSALEWTVRLGGYAVMILTLLLALAVLYRFGPSRNGAKWRWITPGAMLAVLVITAVSGLFSWYAANFAHYDETYGSLGALIGFLFWVWVSVNAVIIGAELNSELEHQTAVDSTVGPDAPMGARRAVMADTLGHATDAEGDDPRAGKSPEWIAGYEAAEGRPGRARQHRPVVPWHYTIPLAVLAIGWLGNRKRD